MNINWKSLDIKQIAEIVSEKLRKSKVDAVLVGGACVSIYTNNLYLSYDLDFVTDTSLKELDKILGTLGYERKKGRLFNHKESEFMLDFVPPPIAIGLEPVKEIKEIKTHLGLIRLLHPTDCVKDRLAAFYHWNDPQSLEQAVMVAKAQRSHINLDNIEKWSRVENKLNKYKEFLNRFKNK